MRERLENFWYHHKWKTIVIAFFAMVVLIGVVQIATRTEYDAQILYAGPSVNLLDSNADTRIAAAFGSLTDRDLDGDGEIHILINSKTVLSDEQLKEKQEAAQEEHDHVAYDPTLRQSTLTEIRTILLTGQVSICLLDPYVYQMYPASENFVPLSDLFSETPEGAVDDYAVRLKDTDFGKQIAFSSLPGDTLICLHRQVGSKKKAVESFEYSKELFCLAINYSVDG